MIGINLLPVAWNTIFTPFVAIVAKQVEDLEIHQMDVVMTFCNQ